MAKSVTAALQLHELQLGNLLSNPVGLPQLPFGPARRTRPVTFPSLAKYAKAHACSRMLTLFSSLHPEPIWYLALDAASPSPKGLRCWSLLSRTAERVKNQSSEADLEAHREQLAFGCEVAVTPRCFVLFYLHVPMTSGFLNLILCQRPELHGEKVLETIGTSLLLASPTNKNIFCHSKGLIRA